MYGPRELTNPSDEIVRTTELIGSAGQLDRFVWNVDRLP
jgi:hypothetical protein